MNFKVIDFMVSSKGYLLKVKAIRPSIQDFQFAYIPFGRYPSLLLLDFLLASRTSQSSDLVDYMEEAVRADVSGYVEPFVLFGGLDGRIGYTGEDVDDVSTQGYRVDNGWKLKVFKEVMISDRVNIKDLQVGRSQLAFRVDQDTLHIEYANEQAKRPIQKAGSNTNTLGLAFRPFTHDLEVHLPGAAAERVFVHDLSVGLHHILGIRQIQKSTATNKTYLTAQRVFSFPMRVETDRLLALREINRNGWVDYNRILGTRDTHRIMKVFNAMSTADRTLIRNLRLEEMIQSLHHTNRPTFIDYSHSMGKFKARQYPATLERLLNAHRSEFKDTRMLYPHIQGTRNNIAGKMYAPQPSAWGHRFIDKVGNTLIEQAWANRIFTKAMNQLSEIRQGKRYIDKNLDVVVEYELAIKEFLRNVSMLKDVLRAWRMNDTKKLYIPNDDVRAVKTLGRNMTIERLGEATKNFIQKQGFISTGEVKGGRATDHAGGFFPTDGTAGGIVPKPAELSENEEYVMDFFHEMRGSLEEAIVSHLETDKHGVLEAIEELGSKTNLPSGELMQEVFLAFVHRIFDSVFLEDVIAWKGFWADLMDDMIFANRHHFDESFIESLFDIAMKDVVGSGEITEEYILGVRNRIEGLIEDNFLLSKLMNERSSIIGIGMEGMTEPTPSILDEGLEGGQEAKSSIVGEDIEGYVEFRPSILEIKNPFGYLEPFPSVIGEGEEADRIKKQGDVGESILGKQEPKPSEIGNELMGQLPMRPSEIGNDLIGQLPMRPSEIGESMQGELPMRPSEIGESMQGELPMRPSIYEEGEMADRPIKGGEVDSDVIADRVQKPSDMGEELLGTKPLRPSEYEEGFEGKEDLRPSLYEEGTEGYEEPRPSTLDYSDYMAELQKRLSVLTTGYLLGFSSNDRASYLYDIYELGVRGIFDGFIPEDDYIKYAKLIADKAFIDEQMFAHNPGKASELFEDIVAHFEPNPSYLHEVLTADKKEHLAAIFTQIVGDKVKAEAIIGEYELAQKILHNSVMEDDPITARMDIMKKALFEDSDGYAQGLMYDYSKQLLDQDTIVDNWTGGFGVPEDYDPHDPFNPYYPWTNELNETELGQGNWKKIGNGNWIQDKEKRQLISTSPGAGGMIYNDFTHDSYIFSVKFQITEASDQAAGVILKYVDDNNYYKFVIHGGDSSGSLGMNKPMQLYKVVNGVETKVGSPMNPFPWTVGAWYVIDCHVVDGRIKIWVNNRMQYDILY